MKNLLLFLFFGACFLGVNAQGNETPTQWSLLGNAGTSPRNFLGTTDTMPIIFKTNGVERMRLLSDNSFLGIGTQTPSAPLHLHVTRPGIQQTYPLLSITSSDFPISLFKLTTTSSGKVSLGCTSGGHFNISGPKGELSFSNSGDIEISETVQGTSRFNVSMPLYAQCATINGNSLNNGFKISYTNTNIFLKQQEQGNFNIEGPGGGLTINPNGNIGMNTDNPQQKLHVENGNILIKRTLPKVPFVPSGSLIFDSNSSGQNIYSTWGVEYVNSESEGYGLNFWKSDSTWGIPTKGIACSPILFLEDGGNVGIWKNKPTATLDVGGSFKAASANITGAVIVNTLKAQTATVTGNTYLEGDVGIGTHKPKQKLHVVDGNILISKTSAKAPQSPNGSILFGANITDSSYMGRWGIEYLDGEDNAFGLNFWKPWNYDDGNWMNYALFLSNDGRVGIGKKDPKEKLDINGAIKAIKANITDTLTTKVLTCTNATIANLTIKKLNVPSINIDTITTKILKAQTATVTGNSNLNGNVTVGTASQNAQLDINGLLKAKSANITGNVTVKEGSFNLSLGGATGQNLGYGTSYIGFNAVRNNGSWTLEGDGANNGGAVIWSTVGGTINFASIPKSNSNSGSPQILTDNEIKNNVKLQLTSAGVLKAKEVQVSLAGWPDFVFDKDYKLPTLPEVEQFIAKNQHLPNVPSAAEVEANGVNVGEMNAILIQKIEELTLYILDLQKQINELKKQ